MDSPGASQGLLLRSHCKKEQNVAEERGYTETEQNFSGPNILVLAPRGKHYTLQHKCRNEVKERSLTVDQSRDGSRP